MNNNNDKSSKEFTINKLNTNLTLILYANVCIRKRFNII